MPNATRPRLVQRRWWLYPWPVAKVTQFTRLQSASILQFQPHVWSQIPLSLWMHLDAKATTKNRSYIPNHSCYQTSAPFAEPRTLQTRPGREGITAITSSTCQKHAELPELSGRHVDRPKPKKLADSNAAFVWTLYTCAVVDSRSPKGWHNHLVKLRARSPLPHRRWWFLKRR